MKLTVLFALAITALAIDAPTNNQTVPVAIEHENGSFSGQLEINMQGEFQKINVRWNGAVYNASNHKIHRAAFCVRAYDAENEQVNPGGEPCVLRLWASDWQPGTALTFKGKQNIQIIPQSKEVLRVSRYAIEATEVLDHPPNVRHIEAPCPFVWSSGIRVFADRRFHPTVMDKDSFTASFDYDGGRIDGSNPATQMLKSFTTASTGFARHWESFRIDQASFYLRSDEPGICTAEVKMSFAGFGRALLEKYNQWYAADSNYLYEKSILDEVERLSREAREADLDQAISQLPTEVRKPESAEAAELTITSEPSGAEIEINGEWIGNTPATLKVDGGTVMLKATISGHQPWERTFRVNPGDRRTIHIGMTRE